MDFDTLLSYIIGVLLQPINIMYCRLLITHLSSNLGYHIRHRADRGTCKDTGQRTTGLPAWHVDGVNQTLLGLTGLSKHLLDVSVSLPDAWECLLDTKGPLDPLGVHQAL